MEIRTKNQKNLEKKQKFGPKTKNIEKNKNLDQKPKKNIEKTKKKQYFRTLQIYSPIQEFWDIGFFCFFVFFWYSRCFFWFLVQIFVFFRCFFWFLVPNLCFFTVFWDFGPNFCVFHLFWFLLQIFVFFKVSLVFINKLLWDSIKMKQ